MNIFKYKTLYLAQCVYILACIRGTEDEVQEFLVYLNNINNNITFTVELEKDEQIF